MKTSQDYIVREKITLSQRATLPKNLLSKKDAKKELSKVRRELAEFQAKLYAHDKHAVLVCFQGMDTSGKDSLVREVFKDFNVRGVIQHSFKVPTDIERSHGYLWRHYIALPSKGHFGIFNRTHYENVLVTRVHPEYLMAENLPQFNGPEDATEEFWQMRFEQINNFEKELAQNGIFVFKFYLHLSKEEQKNRLLRRLRRPEKNWKFSEDDLKERKLWDKYMHCYEQAINNTSKDNAPWHVIPADDKSNARLLVAKILLESLSEHKEIQPPQLDDETSGNIDKYIKALENE
ncbi:PPK2 family polyphosphate:nucleotide phosphotransferase [Nonlabens dokdonensis]|jgi:PPK2 family polyphosphate:nucleotide phosphotransferase|uniref:Polyphosphate kinase n=2 Tax=Nonlabens dokdonensis TaxID=328515 RepID=L7WB79_NONDD|nr:PPK2 family polyphosphate kinase [Nonlabens dokdonensis]AGC77457.1 polyphosphate kinase [Nonlabens dokdonensis DSW-6]PZX40980.1 PPK2 family polyphosphate:nucleotide phosphotransferase [Nonlabens dokdonensis]